jgi:phosphatidylethanolamine-binding protein (PEBP) family uncharacterized protein
VKKKEENHGAAVFDAFNDDGHRHYGGVCPFQGSASQGDFRAA